MLSERRPFQTAFLSNRKTVGKSSRACAIPIWWLINLTWRSAAAALRRVKRQSEQRNGRIWMAEEAAAQGGAYREQEWPAYPEWEERYVVAQRVRALRKGLSTAQNAVSLTENMEKRWINSANIESWRTPNGIKFMNWYANGGNRIMLEELHNQKALIDEMARKRRRKNRQSGFRTARFRQARRYCRKPSCPSTATGQTVWMPKRTTATHHGGTIRLPYRRNQCENPKKSKVIWLTGNLDGMSAAFAFLSFL